MALDIRTLVLVVGVAHIIQFVVFIHQYFINRNCRGVGWWLLWTAAEVLAFGFMLLRAIPAIETPVIIAQNSFLILGVMFLYIGIVRFFDRRENRGLLVLFYALFLAIICYFLYGNNDINVRSVAIDAALAAMALLSARTLLVNKTRAIAVSVNFLAVVFVAHGFHFAIRAAVLLAGVPIDSFFAPTLVNGAAFADAFIVGNLLTFGTIMMINQRLNAEAKEAKEEMELVFNASPDAVLVSRLSDGAIVNVNDGFVDLSGFHRRECVGKTTLAVNIWENPADRDGVVNELRKAGKCRNYETVFRRKDGGELPGLMSAVVFNLQDVPHVLSVVRDITERKRTEAEKAVLEGRNHHLQKAESLGRMAGAIAHLFNNCLQAVMGNLELAMEEQKRGACAAETLREAMAAARQAATVSGLMLTYLGKEPVRLEPLDLADVCRQVLPVLRNAMPTNAALDTELPASGPVVDANSNLLRQLLANLITNAWESMGCNPGRIRLRLCTVAAAEIPAATRHPLDWQPQARDYACLEIADKGCGMAPETLDVVFDPFFSTKFTGRGLGLAVGLGIVRSHNGVIVVKSEVGQGSVFQVFLPVSVQPAPQMPNVSSALVAGATALPAPSHAATRGGTVLVVEDDARVRRVAAHLLSQLGFAVVETQDGVEALEVFPKCRDDIRFVLCDLTMPRLDGWQTLAALRQLAPGIPVILASGYDEASAMAGDHHERPQAFVNKPYQLEDLRVAIRKAVGGEDCAT